MAKVDPYSPALHHPSPHTTTLKWEYFESMWAQPVLAHQSIVCLDDVKSVVCSPVREIDTSQWISIDEYHNNMGIVATHAVRQPTGRGLRRMMGRKWVQQ